MNRGDYPETGRIVLSIIHSTRAYYDVDDELRGAPDGWMRGKVTVVDTMELGTGEELRNILSGWISPLAALKELGVTHVAQKLLVTCNDYDSADLPVIFKARRLGISLDEAERE